MKAVIITGSRDERWEYGAAVDAIADLLDQCELAIHGDCAAGIDRVVVGTTDLQLPMPAQWDRYGKLAGPRRNAEMVNVAKALMECGWDVECHAFPDANSRGTWDCVRRCEAAGIPVTVRLLESMVYESNGSS